MNTGPVSFSTTVRQMTKMSPQKMAEMSQHVEELLKKPHVSIWS